MEQTPWDPEGVDVRLDGEGRIHVTAQSTGPDIDLRALYKTMVAARALDVRLGRMTLPMWAPAAGEEAPLVLLGQLLEEDDWAYPTGRDAALALARGVPVIEILRQALGRPDASVRGTASAGHVASVQHQIAPATESLGLSLPMGVGHAQGQKLARAGRVTALTFGEGVTTTGAFHEAMALAVAGHLPVVFVCRSQLWPERAPAEAGSLGDSVAERASGMGIWSRRIDGADVVAVHEALTTAIEHAREDGPAMVETVVTPLHRDPPPHRDPLERLRRHLDGNGQWTQTFHDVVEAEFRAHFERALTELEGEPKGEEAAS